MILETKQAKWHEIRDAVVSGSGDTDLAATTKKYATVYTNHSSNWRALQPHGNKVELRFRFTNSTANATFSVYALREDGDAVLVCKGTAYAGTQQTDTEIGSATTYMGDKIVISEEYWLTKVVSTCSNDDATNDTARLAFDCCGYKYILPLVPTVSAGSAAVDGVVY